MTRFGTYLLKNGFGIYHFRIAVPTDLRPVLGKREIKKSLGTSDAIHAKKKASMYAFAMSEFFQEVRRMSKKTLPYVHISDFGIAKVRLPDGTELENLTADPDHPTDTEKLLQFLNQLRGTTPSAQAAVPVGVSAQQEKKKILTLSGLFELYKNEKKQSGDWASGKTERDHDATFNAVLRILGDCPVTDLTKESATDLKNLLYKLPSNITKKPLYRNKSIDQVLALKPKDTLSHHAVKKYLDRLSAVFKFSVDHGYTEINAFQTVKPKPNKVKASALRSAYTPIELSTLFSSKIYTDHEYEKAHHFWLPLLALFTGARLSELCQLRLEDIYSIENVLVIDINEEAEDQSVKTERGIRKVPIHSAILNLNFADYLYFLEKKKADRLFPDVVPYLDKRYGSRDWGHYASKWYSGYLEKLGLKRPRLTFHSFRHTLITELKNKLVPTELAAALAGHSVPGMTYGVYGKDYDVHILKAEIEKADFSSVISGVKPY